MSFPNKEERGVCWGARDKYWECLDQHGEKDAIATGPCAELRKFYENSCTSQWVKHFDRKRSYLNFKKRIETEGIPNKILKDSNFQKRRIYSQILIKETR